MTFSTAGLLFPAISLLMLAYTNRFLGLASVVRHLVTRYREHPDPDLRLQVDNLRGRIMLLRHAQAAGVLSLLLCTGSLFALFMDSELIARLSFGGSLLMMLGSLGISLWEIQLSSHAINIELDSLSVESQLLDT